jgi:mRNA interferase RelE/StbE
MKPVTYRKQPLKMLRRMPANVARRVRDKVNDYAADPASQANNIKALQGRAGIRLRVGDWRVIMLDGEVIDIIEINPRGGAY